MTTSRLLQQLRDEAVAECERQSTERRGLQGAYDDLLVVHREQCRLGDVQLAELQGQLKLAQFEGDRQGALAGERGA